jgi:hypothetical protein
MFFNKYQQNLFVERKTKATIVLHHTNNNSIVSTIPACVKYNPILNIVVLGRNIRNDDNINNNSETPKKTFRKTMEFSYSPYAVW